MHLCQRFRTRHINLDNVAILAFILMVSSLFFYARNWKMRWFVLRDSKLMYYDNDSEEKLKGTIDIRAAK